MFPLLDDLAGNIGKLVRDHMQHFGMKVIYSNRRRLPPEEEKSAAFVSFDEILTRSDVLSINCPLTKETRHLLDKEGEFRGYSHPLTWCAWTRLSAANASSI